MNHSEKLRILSSVQDNGFLEKIRQKISHIVKDQFNIELNSQDVGVDFNVNFKGVDITSNVVFKLIGHLKGHYSINEIASRISQFFTDDSIEKVEAVNGYLNFFNSSSFIFKKLEEILTKEDRFGYWDVAKGTLMVEFGQPNTHKAMTAGHIKSAVTGLAVSRILETLGYKVIRANYYSDIGLNVAKCTWAFMNKYSIDDIKDLDLYKQVEIINECYVQGHNAYKSNEESRKQISEVNKIIYEKSDDGILKIYEYLRDISLMGQREFFNTLGVKYDREYAESETVDIALKIVKQNLSNVFLYDQGAIIFPGERYGFNRWVFVNSAGYPTYSAKDLGLAKIKFDEYPELLLSIVLTSTEQLNYFTAVIKAIELIYPNIGSKYVNLGFGWLLKDNKKMSSKLGNAVGVWQLFEDAYLVAKNKISQLKQYDNQIKEKIAQKVFLAGLKFLFLSREFHLDINYDPLQFLDPKGFSGPYILYAYVRAISILREANKFDKVSPKGEETQNYYPNGLELEILKKLIKYEYVTIKAAKHIQPHFVATYLFDICQLFNKFYKENRVNVSERHIRNFRLRLVKAFSIVVKNGLYLLGIDTVENM